VLANFDELSIVEAAIDGRALVYLQNVIGFTTNQYREGISNDKTSSNVLIYSKILTPIGALKADEKCYHIGPTEFIIMVFIGTHQHANTTTQQSDRG